MSNQDNLRWLMQNLRPSTPSLGLSGGVGPIQGGPGCPPMSKKELQARRDAGLPMPNGFTGVWGGVQWYKGKRWEGPSNAVGQGRLVMVERTTAGGYGIRAVG